MRVAQAPMDKRCGKALVPALSAVRRVGKDKPVAGGFAIATHSHLSHPAGSNPVIARTGRQPIAIHCPRCPHVSDDERLLLHAASLTQAGHSHMAEKALCAALLSAQGAEFVNSRLAPCKGWVDSSPKQDSFPSAPIACHGTSTGWGGGTVEPVGAAGNDPLIGE
jgi:hypothetical protein